MRIWRFLVGYRDDLDLQSRWWHRLLKVVFVLTALLAFMFFTIAAHRQPTATTENTQVIETLHDYIQAHKPVPNAVPGFAALPGMVGIRKKDGKIEERFFLESQVFCSWDLMAHPEEEARFLSVNHPGEFSNVTVAQVKEWMQDAKEDTKPGSCLDPADVLPNDSIPASQAIVRFEFTTSAKAMSWLKASGEVAMYLVPIMLVLMNVYYRGIVYVICGPRKKSGSAPAAVR